MKECVEHDKDLDVLCSDCNVVMCYRCHIAYHNRHCAFHTDDIKKSLLNVDYSVVAYDHINSNHNHKEKEEEINKDNNINNNKDGSDHINEKEMNEVISNKDDRNNKNNSNKQNDNNIIQNRIQILWNKSKESVNHIQKLSEIENQISDHFKQYYEMLMKEESKLKQPIIDEIDQTKQQLDQIIKEIQSLHNIIQSITPTLKPDEKSNNHDHDIPNNNNEYDILPDITINYSLPTLIESIRQTKTFDQFIHNNSNTIFNLENKKQTNNEIIEYLKDNNETNKNKRHKNNDNNKTSNNNIYNSILGIIRNHFNQHNIDQIVYKNNISIDKNENHQSYFNGVINLIRNSLNLKLDADKTTNNIKHIITMDDDNIVSLYKWDYKSGNQMELMENESKELTDLIRTKLDTDQIFFVSSNSTIYVFPKEDNIFIAYSIIDNKFRLSSFYPLFHPTFIGQPCFFSDELCYLYLYCKSNEDFEDNTLIIRFNTILEEFELFHYHNNSKDSIPVALIDNHHSIPYTFNIYYDSSLRVIFLARYNELITDVEEVHPIISKIEPTFITSCFAGKTGYLYYGDENQDYFIKIESIYDYKITNLATIEGRATIEIYEQSFSTFNTFEQQAISEKFIQVVVNYVYQ
ncbi:hypothetical protein PPL_04919 [Heterostelium album PN500]|uniref:B box-type domain-containing protein n=1 Tax=Heterostelium pallidum (strain ATCC 26659 / Pp 5 / PN500) TaxID=670386 RepID=D3B8X6_HETP5|nr:hypothetical protein PPL_04919 [Heterostelium album PN500]EFA82494.1 hypothetical protein PPL_04919 [Heterostelium album PN500]|eukprot:XP_020434611.1 hypothetical protein PPL_04919 [Heterostelium album PN500]